MRKSLLSAVGLLLAASLPIATAQAASLLEPPDISSNIAAPTLFNLDAGSNLLTANSGGPGSGATNGTDAEFITVVVPTGLVLDAVDVVSRSGPSFGSFLGYNVGATLSGQTSGDLAGFVIFNAFSGDLLTAALLGVDALAAGTYAFWIQETAGAVDYTLDFVVTPEPSTAALLTLGGLGLGWLRRSTRRT
ncbi:MAG: PEP-CTERM sorting domain-containing protein [Myxococcota bacterium]